MNARSLQDIVFNAFAPLDVGLGVEKLMSDPTFDKADLYGAVIEALSGLESRLRGTPRDVSMLAAEISRHPTFEGVTVPQIRDAVIDLARASSGMLHVSDRDEVSVIGALDELRRRVSNLTGQTAPPRRRGTFRAIAANGEESTGAPQAVPDGDEKE